MNECINKLKGDLKSQNHRYKQSYEWIKVLYQKNIINGRTRIWAGDKQEGSMFRFLGFCDKKVRVLWVKFLDIQV